MRLVLRGPKASGQGTSKGSLGCGVARAYLVHEQGPQQARIHDAAGLGRVRHHVCDGDVMARARVSPDHGACLVGAAGGEGVCPHAG